MKLWFPVCFPMFLVYLFVALIALIASLTDIMSTERSGYLFRSAFDHRLNHLKSLAARVPTEFDPERKGRCFQSLIDNCTSLLYDFSVEGVEVANVSDRVIPLFDRSRSQLKENAGEMMSVLNMFAIPPSVPHNDSLIVDAVFEMIRSDSLLRDKLKFWPNYMSGVGVVELVRKYLRRLLVREWVQAECGDEIFVDLMMDGDSFRKNKLAKLKVQSLIRICANQSSPFSIDSLFQSHSIEFSKDFVRRIFWKILFPIRNKFRALQEAIIRIPLAFSPSVKTRCLNLLVNAGKSLSEIPCQKFVLNFLEAMGFDLPKSEDIDSLSAVLYVFDQSLPQIPDKYNEILNTLRLELPTLLSEIEQHAARYLSPEKVEDKTYWDLLNWGNLNSIFLTNLFRKRNSFQARCVLRDLLEEAKMYRGLEKLFSLVIKFKGPCEESNFWARFLNSQNSEEMVLAVENFIDAIKDFLILKESFLAIKNARFVPDLVNDRWVHINSQRSYHNFFINLPLMSSLSDIVNQIPRQDTTIVLRSLVSGLPYEQRRERLTCVLSKLVIKGWRWRYCQGISYDEHQCPICLEPIDLVVTPPCGHMYHLQCVMAIIDSTNPVCALCRALLPKAYEGLSLKC